MTPRVGMALRSALAFALAGPAAAQAEKARAPRIETIDAYAEWRSGGCLIADAQRICPADRLKFKGSGEARDFASIPLGYELKAKGTRSPDGRLLASEIEAKPNRAALFEGEVKAATDAAEAQARRQGRFYEDPKNARGEVGRLYEDGPYVARVRRIVDGLLPPYLDRAAVRVYAIQNKEWNAFAMGNYSIYVFTGLLDDMDDDEVAIVLGHELVHATHEHSRKEFKRAMWVQLAALGVLAASSEIDDEKKRTVVQLATGLAAMAYSNGYERGMEDQADRVGLRYAYEAGYDISKGPSLWNRFAQKYGEGNKVVNFFFANHSASAARATKLKREIAFNYPDGPKSERTARESERTAREGVAPAPPEAAVEGPRPGALPGTTQALVTPGGTPRAAAPPVPQIVIEPGMTLDQVREALGEPRTSRASGDTTRWVYPDLTVVFEKGKVADVLF